MTLLIPILLLFSTVHAADIDSVFEIGREYNIRPADLQAMSFVETEHSYNEKWDEGNGREYGLYCINIKLHKITKAQACDPEFATRWTCRNLLKNNYKQDRRKAIERHCGSGKKAQAYARVVLRYSEKFERR